MFFRAFLTGPGNDLEPRVQTPGREHDVNIGCIGSGGGYKSAGTVDAASRRVFSLAASPTSTSHLGSSPVKLFSLLSITTNPHGLSANSRATLAPTRPAP